MRALRRVRRSCAAAAATACAFFAPALASAHPMGNFSISRYAALHVTADAIELRYIVDMAEIPTFQELQDNAIVAHASDATVGPYLARQATALASRLTVEIDGRRMPLEATGREVLFTPGAGGLPTMKLGMRYRASYDRAAVHELAYRDENFAERTGWKEVIADAAPDVVLAESSVPSRDRSRELSDYPTDLLNSPPQVTAARVAFTPAPAPPVIARVETSGPAPPRASAPSSTGRRGQGVAVSSGPAVDRAVSAPRASVEPREAAPRAVSGAGDSGDRVSGVGGAHQRLAAHAAIVAPDVALTALQPNAQKSRRDRFTELIAMPQMSAKLLLFAALVAAALGAVHALEPGHGKTVVAAYLVGSRGTARHAMLLGLAVTASHTAGVYLLGAVTLYASRYVVPDRLYPWLGALSGVLIAALGIAVFARRARGHGHHHEHAGAHDGCGRGHDQADGHAHGAHDPHDHAHDGSRGAHDLHADAHGPHHHGHGHTHGARGHHHHVPTDVSLRELLALGITGGILPCPAALVVLLSAVALRRVGLGLFLIAAFSVGLAAVLIAVGMLMVYARALMARVHGDGVVITRWLPIASSAVVTLLGFAIAVQSLAAGGVVNLRLG